MIATKLLALALMAVLNPLVARTPLPHGNVPADCQVSDAAPMTRARVTADDVSEDGSAAPVRPVTPAARATASLKPTSPADVAELRRALAANDRPAFDAALVRAREAGVATRVYDDVARIWDAQFESPFFAEDSDAYRVASSYPGYAEAVRRQVFTDASGKKYYPAGESRAFVATHAGVRSPTTRRITTTTPAAKTTTAKPTLVTPRPRSTSSTGSKKKASGKPAASRKKAPPGSPDPSASPKSAAREPAPAASPVVDTSTPEAPPAAASRETAPPPPSVVADTMATDIALTDTTSTDTTATDSTAANVASDTSATFETATTTTASQTTRGRPILIPAILILIGLGVLILLFRTKA